MKSEVSSDMLLLSWIDIFYRADILLLDESNLCMVVFIALILLALIRQLPVTVESSRGILLEIQITMNVSRKMKDVHFSGQRNYSWDT